VIEQEESGDIVITVNCTMRPEESGADAQRTSEEIERALRESIKGSSRVAVHVEPEKAGGTVYGTPAKRRSSIGNGEPL
jgi:divalent metal cation (Fe/Co/Zn/Cd) transporter